MHTPRARAAGKVCPSALIAAFGFRDTSNPFKVSIPWLQLGIDQTASWSGLLVVTSICSISFIAADRATGVTSGALSRNRDGNVYYCHQAITKVTVFELDTGPATARMAERVLEVKCSGCVGAHPVHQEPAPVCHGHGMGRAPTYSLQRPY